MKPTYSELLRDPRWQRKRLEIMQRDDFKCRECEAADKTLNVHHRYYEKGLMPWEYASDTLMTLCERCHKSEDFHRVATLRALSANKAKSWELLMLAENADDILASTGAISLILANRLFSQAQKLLLIAVADIAGTRRKNFDGPDGYVHHLCLSVFNDEQGERAPEIKVMLVEFEQMALINLEWTNDGSDGFKVVNFTDLGFASAIPPKDL